MKKFTSTLALAVLATLTTVVPASDAAISNAQAKTATEKATTSSINVIASPKTTSQVVTNIISDDLEKTISSNWVREMANDTYSGAISTNYARGGSSSFRVELRNTDELVNDSKRSEIAELHHEQALGEYTYNFGMLLPKGGDEDYALDPDGSEIIAQWHNSPDPGEEWTVPPLALRTLNGRYVLERYWDDAELSTTDEIKQKGNYAVHDLGSYESDKGKFVTWKFHIKWGWLASQKPTIEIYKDGVKVLELKDLPNTTNDTTGVYMKLGIYKWDWAHAELGYSILTKRVVYYDEISVM